MKKSNVILIRKDIMEVMQIQQDPWALKVSLHPHRWTWVGVSLWKSKVNTLTCTTLKSNLILALNPGKVQVFAVCDHLSLIFIH